MIYDLIPHAYAPLVATLFWSICIGVIAHFVVFRIPLFDSLVKAPIVPPFMALPAILFAFLMAFMASAVWQNISLARTALVNEHAAITRLAAVPIGHATTKQQLQDGLKRYMAAVLDEEWIRRHNQRSSPDAAASLDTLEAGIWTAVGQCKVLGAGDCTSDLAVSTYLKALDDLRSARDQRLSLGFQGSMNIKWMLGIVLAFVTALSIAAIHRSAPKTAALCQLLFCFSAWMTFAMVDLHIQPYRGPDALSPSVLQDLRARL